MRRAIRVVFEDETEWSTVLEALRQTRDHKLGIPGHDHHLPDEIVRASAIAIWARERLNNTRNGQETKS